MKNKNPKSKKVKRQERALNRWMDKLEEYPEGSFERHRLYILGQVSILTKAMGW